MEKCVTELKTVEYYPSVTAINGVVLTMLYETRCLPVQELSYLISEYAVTERGPDVYIMTEDEVRALPQHTSFMRNDLCQVNRHDTGPLTNCRTTNSSMKFGGVGRFSISFKNTNLVIFARMRASCTVQMNLLLIDGRQYFIEPANQLAVNTVAVTGGVAISSIKIGDNHFSGITATDAIYITTSAKATPTPVKAVPMPLSQPSRHTTTSADKKPVQRPTKSVRIVNGEIVRS